MTEQRHVASWSLTDDEEDLLDRLGQVFTEFCGLGNQHPDDKQDMLNAIHSAQRIIMCRAVRRSHPGQFS